ncbi:MAG: flagellar filament outer layer protein FlaA [Spirochaetales bacterium]|nr:flagellar filament outer layer protein FlaA [Spirochaetales bacterium]
MKRGFRTSCRLLVIVLLLGPAVAALADEVAFNLVPRVLQSFDPAEEQREIHRTWKLIPSKFGYDRNGNSLWESRLVEAWPESLFGKNKDGEELAVLGLHGKFLRKGYNYVEIVPGTGEGDNFEPKPIPIPGRAHYLDLWVWGSNHAYLLEAHVRDFQGIDHVLPIGSIQFTGWKNLQVKVPGSIPQAWQYLPRRQGLDLTKLVLWTQPIEKVDDFYLYIDQIKVTTDVFETFFDGFNLTEAEKLQEIWGTRAN